MLLISVTVAPAGIAATTNSGYIACTSETALDDMVSFVTAKDNASFQAYINVGKCVVLKTGERS